MPFIDTRDRDVKRNIDYSKAVDVVVSHKTNGDYIPLYFRAKDYDEVLQTYKVTVKFIKEKKGCTTFRCIINNYGRQQEVYLTHYIEQHIWILER